MTAVDHTPLVRLADRDDTEQLRHDRQTLAFENGALRDEVEQLRAQAATADAEAKFCEDEIVAAWAAMPEEVRRAAEHDDTGLPSAIATLTAAVERVLPGWFTAPAEWGSRHEPTSRAEAHLRRTATGESDLAESCGLVLAELDLYRRLRTAGHRMPDAGRRTGGNR